MGIADEKSVELESMVTPSDNTPSEAVSYEAAMDQIGVNFIQYGVLAACGMGNAVDAVEILSVSYILPELLKNGIVTKTQAVMISSSVFAGMLVGGLFFGLAADRFGRRKSYIITMLMNSICAATFSMSETWWIMCGLRFLTGVGVGGAVPAVFTLGLEILPSKKRGFFLNYVPSFWMVGAVTIALMAAGILRFFSWHVFALACSIPPGLCVVIGFVFLPESPRFLLTHGRVQEAEEVLARLGAHDGMSRRIVPLRFTLLPLAQTEELSILTQIISLFRFSLLRSTLLFAIIWFSLSFGWYGMFMWMPDLLQKHGISDPNVSTIMVNAASLPGNIMAAFLLDRVGRRLFLSLSILVAAFSALAFNQIQNRLIAILFYCSLNCFSTAGWNALGIMSVEAFPTPCRTTAAGLLGATGRVGAMVSQAAFLSGDLLSVMINFAILLSGATAAALLKKESSNVGLDDTVSVTSTPQNAIDDEGRLLSP